jgi:hypothetical protein
VSSFGAPHEYINIHTRQDVMLAARLFEGMGIQRPMRYYSCRTRQHRYSILVVSKVTRAGMLDSPGETHASAK